MQGEKEMKICILNVTHRNAESHRNALIESCKKVASPGTEIVYKDTKKGALNLVDHGFGYTRLLNSNETIESMLEAQHEGCDAVMTDWTLDAGIPEAQEALDILVIPIAEACLKYATLLGQRIGVITLYERRWVNHYRRMIKTYGLDDFCIE